MLLFCGIILNMNERTQIFLYYAYKVGLHVFALAGFVLVVGFFAVRWHWTDVSGTVDANSTRFQANAQAKVLGVESQKNSEKGTSLDKIDIQIKQLSQRKELKTKNYCLIDLIGQYSPQTASKIIEIYQQTDSDELISKIILANRIRIEEKNGSDVFKNCDEANTQPDIDAISKKYLGAQGESVFPWMHNEQWTTIKQAIVKDKDVIEKTAAVAGVEPRLVVSCAIVEQVRLFNSSRELFSHWKYLATPIRYRSVSWESKKIQLFKSKTT